MSLVDVVASFFGGVFLANFVPHFIAGVSGRPFQTPFAQPPFRGLSSPTVNVLWGMANLAVAYALLVVVGGFSLGDAPRVGVSSLGFGLAAVGIARSVGRMVQAAPPPAAS